MGSTCSPGRLKPRSKVLRGRPALPGYLRWCPMARGVEQTSGVIAGMPKGPRGPADVPGVLCPVQSEGPRCQRALPADSGQDLRSAGFTCLSGESGPCPRAHGFGKHPGRLWTLLGAAVSNSCPRELALGPRAPGVDQLSLATRASVRVPEGSKSSPGRLALGFQGPRGRPDVFGNSGPVPRDGGVDKVTKATRGLARVPTGQPDLLGHSGPALRACGFDQLSRATRACVQGTAGLTSTHGPLGFVSAVPQVLSALPGVSRSGPIVRRVK